MASVPSFVTRFVLNIAFPKMLSTFRKSAELEWTRLQEERRARFEVPLQAAADSIDIAVRELERAADLATAAAMSLANATAVDLALRLNDIVSSLGTARASTQATASSQAAMKNPKVKSVLNETTEYVLLRARGFGGSPAAHLQFHPPPGCWSLHSTPSGWWRHPRLRRCPMQSTRPWRLSTRLPLKRGVQHSGSLSLSKILA